MQPQLLVLDKIYMMVHILFHADLLIIALKCVAKCNTENVENAAPDIACTESAESDIVRVPLLFSKKL